VVVAMDETFFGDFLILVLMDISSGYLLLEDISDDRRFERVRPQFYDSQKKQMDIIPIF